MNKTIVVKHEPFDLHSTILVHTNENNLRVFNIASDIRKISESSKYIMDLAYSYSVYKIIIKTPLNDYFEVMSKDIMEYEQKKYHNNKIEVTRGV